MKFDFVGSRWFQPLMIIILAVVVGTIVIAMFMPMIQIIGSLGSSGG